jgi:hypothetical protein
MLATTLFTVGALLIGLSVPCVIMGRQSKGKPPAPNGQNLIVWSKYLKEMENFESRQRAVTSVMVHWNVGVIIGIMPLLTITSLF